MTNKYDRALQELTKATRQYTIHSYGAWLNTYQDTVYESLRAMKLVADGTHVIVPVEPTTQMKISGDHAGFWCGDKYKAMIKSYTHKEE